MKTKQRWFLTSVSLFTICFVLIASSPLVFAAEVSDLSGYFEFNTAPMFPPGAGDEATGNFNFFQGWENGVNYVNFVTLADGRQFSRMRVEQRYDQGYFSTIHLFFDDVHVYTWNYEGDYFTYSGYWIQPAYFRIRFPEQQVDSWFYAWLMNAGVFASVNDQLTPPDIDPGDLLPDQLNGAEYAHISSIVNSLWQNPILLAYVTVLISMLILAFVIFGSRR